MWNNMVLLVNKKYFFISNYFINFNLTKTKNHVYTTESQKATSQTKT